ncbi:putative zinc metalloprotease [Neochlamydia sp. EPS4]|nr:putative zinc metalloprotease [Neochlamydia sp. EPS4]
MLLMIFSFLYIILAVLALSFLIFIHELGHYYMARRVGMRVETFAIGFGKPIFSWIRDGVKWQIGWILFGGYVKIAGQDLGKDQSSYEAPDSFFSKRPIERIKVAFMGPFVNLLFAFLVFCLLWVSGGRYKNFSEYTSKIGWIDPKSELYKHNVRPGDELSSYDNKQFQSSKDHLYAAMMGAHTIQVQGKKVAYDAGVKTPFKFTVKTYPHPAAMEKGILTTGILQPANYILYDRLPNGAENPLPDGSPLQGSGIQYGDRIVWADGELIFSSMQLSSMLNDDRVLLVVQRGDKRLLARAPRVPMQELRFDTHIKDELTDWQYAVDLNHLKLQDLYVLPYNLTNQAVVENSLKFIDKEKEEEAFPPVPFSSLEAALQPGDKILAIHNTPIKSSAELLKQLQSKRVTLIVQRELKAPTPLSWQEADKAFDQKLHWQDLQKIIDGIAALNPLQQAGEFVLLNPLEPKTRSQIFLSPEKQAWLAAETLQEKKQIEAVEDPELRARAMQHFTVKEKELMLGLPAAQDAKVNYNPAPTQMFMSVFDEIWRTLKALFTGALNPKWMSGPIGIVQVVHDSWMISMQDALFWIGAISLNLGILNLLPVPVLDGGTIVMSFMEMLTGRKISSKMLEKLVLPFAILLIGMFLYLTINDLSRIFGGFFHW